MIWALLLTGGIMGVQTAQAQDWSRILGAGAKLVQAGTISDEALAQYISQYVSQFDAKNEVCGPNDPYTIRLDSITK